MAAIPSVHDSSGPTSRSKTFSVQFSWFILAFVVLSSIYVGYRMYQQANGMSVGLDSTEPVFQQVWMRLFWTQLPVLFGAAALVQLYLIFTRDKNIDSVTPEVELKRYFYLTMWLVVYTTSALSATATALACQGACFPRRDIESSSRII